MTADTTTVRIIDTESETALYRHYDQQTDAQPAYIELDLREGTLNADYNSEIGNAVPADVWHGITRRYSIPVLTGTAADRTMQDIAALADRILADSTIEWDGNNNVGVLGDDAQAAEAAIEAMLGCHTNYGDEKPFTDEDLVGAWDLDGATNGSEADDFDITPETTDARLDEIEAEILAGLAECTEYKVNVCHGLDAYLRQVRDDLANED